MVKYALFCVFALFASCTAYQPVGRSVSGGHSFKRLGPDVFEVAFDANSFTTLRRTNDLATLRAAEVCMEHGFAYYSVIGEDDRSGTETWVSGATAQSTGYVSPYTGMYTGTTTYTPHVMSAYKPGKGVTIRCYTAPPGGHAGKVYTASAVASELRAKYKIKTA